MVIVVARIVFRFLLGLVILTHPRRRRRVAHDSIIAVTVVVAVVLVVHAIVVALIPLSHDETKLGMNGERKAGAWGAKQAAKQAPGDPGIGKKTSLHVSSPPLL